MGIEFLACNSNGDIVISYSVKWLRDDAPHALFWHADVHKFILQKSDLIAYEETLRNYIQDLVFVKGNPDADDEDPEAYNRWKSPDGTKEIDDSIYERVVFFIDILEECVKNNWTAYWSY